MENKRKKEGSSMGGNGSRWQPTKDQIDILESVYSAGVKTPSADQIQQITARLSVYGHIEGKNVFYWFQNTKARRRQKLKQDRLAFLTTPTTHFYHQPPPYYSPTSFIPNVEAGYYYYPYETVDQGLTTERAVGPAEVEARRWDPCKSTSIKTLELFPLTPGGSKMEIINGGGGGDNSTDSNCSDQTMNDEYSACKAVQGFIDFFSANSSAATDETVFIN